MAQRRVTIIMRPDADQTVKEIAAPHLPKVGAVIAETIPEYVPVDQGVAKASYSTSVEEGTSGSGDPQARVHVGSPFWHWLEYGTRWNTPYRPVQRAVESLGLRYEPK